MDDFRLAMVDIPIANLPSAIGNENLLFGGCGTCIIRSI
jgi:hypothetical protein